MVENISIHYNAEPQTAELLLRISVSVNQLVHSSPSTGTPVANVEDDPASQVPSEDVSNLTKSTIWNSGARGDSVRQHEEKIENLPEDLQLTEACDDAGRIINECLSWTTLCYNSRYSFGRIWLCKLMSIIFHPRNDARSQPKGFIRGSTKIEIKID